MFRKGIQVFCNSMRFFLYYPICIVPLLVTWCIYAGIILYFHYDFPFEQYELGATLGILFAVYVLYAFLFGLSCLILLEVVQQIQAGQKPSLVKATLDTIIRDFGKAIPVLLVWAVLWFFLVILETLFSKKKESEDIPEDFSAKSAVGTLLGAEQKVTLSSAFFAALSKGVRMIAFLILPAIAWEDLPSADAMKKGMQTLHTGKEQFLVAYGLTELFAVVVLLVPLLLYEFDDIWQLPEIFWSIVLIYMAFASSLIFLVEQLYAAQLYLWHQNWEKACLEREQAGKAKPRFSDAYQPELFQKFFPVEGKS